MTFKKLAGLAGFGCAATYIFGFAYLFAVLVPSGFEPAASSGAETLASIRAAGPAVQLWYIVIYIVNAVLLGVLVTGLADHLTPSAPVLARWSQVSGTIWATLVLGAGMIMNVGLSRIFTMTPDDPTAAQMWLVIDLIENGLGGGNEITGSIWALSIAAAALAGGAMSRTFAGFSLLIGLSGLATIVGGPMAEIAGTIYGLGFIAWFIWTGIVLLRDARSSQ
ncbi:MAG: hypothetical protein MK098_09250 [Marinovum sp.]|nr:hypothetical protein [Marinovum sp.]